MERGPVVVCLHGDIRSVFDQKPPHLPRRESEHLLAPRLDRNRRFFQHFHTVYSIGAASHQTWHTDARARWEVVRQQLNAASLSRLRERREGETGTRGLDSEPHRSMSFAECIVERPVAFVVLLVGVGAHAESGLHLRVGSRTIHHQGSLCGADRTSFLQIF